MTEPVTNILSEGDIEFCRLAGITVGFDDDDPDKHQFSHLCWPLESRAGALCKSPRLWFRGNPLDAIDCPTCYQYMLGMRIRYPRELLEIIGRLARRTELLNDVARETRDLLELMDHPEKYVGKDWARVPAARERLDEALRAEAADDAWQSQISPERVVNEPPSR